MEFFLFLIKFLMVQCVAAVIILFILKKILDRKLYETAIRRLEFLARTDRPLTVDHVIVVSHKKLSLKNKERIQRAVSKHFADSVKPVFEIDKGILGGIIITAGDQTFTYSLKHRLNLAFSGKEGS